MPGSKASLRERFPSSSFLASVRPLQTFRYTCFVLCYSAALMFAVVLLFVTAFRHVFGAPHSPQDNQGLLLTIGLTTILGGLGGWLLKLAKGEEVNLAEQEGRELERLRFAASEDRRRINNAHIDRLLKSLPSLTPRIQEKVVSECLGRLLPGAPRLAKAPGKTAAG